MWLLERINSATMAAINKGTSQSVKMLPIIQKLFWLSIQFSFKLTSAFLPGRLNVLSDRISRMSESDAANEAKALLTVDDSLETCGHMSYETFSRLQGCWGMI